MIAASLPAPGRPIHILMTADAVGGVFTYARDLAKGMSGEGVRITLAMLGPKANEEQKRSVRAISGLRLIETGLPLDWTAAEPAALRRAAAGVAELAWTVRPDLIHLNSPALAATVRYPAPVIGVCHSCLQTWWQAVKGGDLPANFRWRTETLADGYRRCDALVAPSAAFAAATAAAYDIPPPEVVRNGRFPTTGSIAPGSEMTVLTAGRLWDEGKNLRALDAAAAALPVPISAAGPTVGPNGETIDLRNIRPLGVLNDVALGRKMAASAVFATVARYEPFGLAVLEAAQAGCALVLSDIPTFRELWQNAALFVPADEPSAIAAGVRALFADPEQMIRHRRAAQRRARRYDAATMTQNMRAVYDRLLAGRRAVA